MTSYTFHLPSQVNPGDPAALERSVLVKDGFSLSALVFSVFWFLWYRLWIGALVALLIPVGLGLLTGFLGLNPAAAFWVQALFLVLVGLEANSVRRWSLTKQGRPAVDVVVASNRQDAEAKAYHNWLALSEPPLNDVTHPTGLPAQPIPRRHPNLATHVIGLFPEPERSR